MKLNRKTGGRVCTDKTGEGQRGSLIFDKKLGFSKVVLQLNTSPGDASRKIPVSTVIAVVAGVFF